MNLRRKDSAVPVLDQSVRAPKPGGKNTPTPRRTQARAERAQQLKGAPLTSKDRRLKARATAEASRAALKETDTAKLPAHERQPELVYARDLVDTRVNLGTAIIPVAAIYFVGSFFFSTAFPKNLALSQGWLFLLLLWAVAMIVDAYVMSAKLERRVRDRFPGSTLKVRMYAGRRAFALKRMRRPVIRDIPPANYWKAPTSS